MLVNGEKVSCGCKYVENRNHLKYYDRGIADGTMISAIDGSRKTNKNNSSGMTGVSFDSSRGKWIAQIMFQRVHHLIRRFDSKEETIQARLKAEEQYFVNIENNNYFCYIE